MKITGYQQSIDTGGTVKATVKTVGNALAYGTDGSGLTAMSNAAGQWAAAIERQQENEDKEAILNAMDIFNKSRYNIMYNEESGLMNTKLEGSAGIGQSYSEQIDKARADVLGNIKLHSKKNQLALDHLMYNSAREGFQTVDRWQTKQHEAVIDLRYGNNIENASEYVQKNWDNPEAVEIAIHNAALMTSLTYGKRGAEFVEAKTRLSVGKTVASAIDASITNEDYATTRKYLDKYGDLLTAEQRASFEKIAYAKESSAFERNTAKELFAKYGDNEEAALAAVGKMNGFSGGESGDEFSKLMASFGIQESGGNYNAKNGRTGASGKYQILPKNWPSWSQEAGLPAGSEMTPENQEKVARFKLRQYYDKYGAEGAAVAWYSGETNAQRWVGGKTTDVWGQPWDAPQHGNEPSIKEYAKSVTGRAGSTQTSRPMSQDEQDRVMAQYRKMVNDNKRIERYNRDKAFEAAQDTLMQMFQNGISYEEALAWAEKDAGSDYKKLQSNKNAVGLIWGGHGSNGKSGRGTGIGSGGREIMADYLQKGKFANEEQFLTFAQSQGATDNELRQLRNTYKDWMSGEGIFKYNLDAIATDIVPAGLKGEAKTKASYNAKVYARNQIRQYRAAHDGKSPSYAEVVDMVQKGFTDTVSSSYVTSPGWLWDSTKKFSYSRAELAGRGIVGISPESDDENPYLFDVDFSDGTSKIMGADELDRYMGGK